MRSRLPARSGTDSLTALLGHFANSCDDVRVSGAPTDVAAHPLGDFGIGQSRCGRDIRRRIAGPAGSVFVEERDGGADLPGCAVAALKSVMPHEGGLHRVQNALLR